MASKLFDAAKKHDKSQTARSVVPTGPKRNAAASIAQQAGRAARTGGAARADGANGGRATARRAVATAEAIEREVRVAYEARRRPAPPGVDAGGGSASVWDWFRDEAAAMHEIASRLVPAGWPWGIQMELFPPGVRLVLNGRRHAQAKTPGRDAARGREEWTRFPAATGTASSVRPGVWELECVGPLRRSGHRRRS